MGIRAIETRYAGCRMRSRLEARWAVFFDFTQIAWEYEPQGISVTLGRRARGLNWLPDFQLPEVGQLIEVKGKLDDQGLSRLLTIASEVSQCGSAGQDIVVLGPVPRSSQGLWPVQLHSHRGLWALPWDLMTGCPLTQHRPHLALHKMTPKRTSEILLGGMPGCKEPSWATGALDKARSARFEHGESG